MLTRFKVTGFKNLVDVDVRFGPFTCIAGANGVGKSNLFDAIRFLGATAGMPLVDAAKLVRDGKTFDIRSLFHRVGDEYDDVMKLEAEMLIPAEGEDDLRQKAEASITFLRYSLELAQRNVDDRQQPNVLEVRRETLTHYNKGDASKHLWFPNSKVWRESVVKGALRSELISTEEKDAVGAVIYLHQNRGGDQVNKGGGRPAPLLAATLPKTVLSSATNATVHRTALLARREMESWRPLQLEPSALREPNDFTAPSQLSTNGSNLAATIYRLARSRRGPDEADGPDEEGVFAELANRLSELIDDVREVGIDRDLKRELLTLYVKGRDGTPHPARALSDGTLRFLALAAIELDPSASGVLCLEEPENGIHPARIPAMLKLLQDIATNVDHPVGPENPLRQVIINTHSPAVVGEVPEDSLIVAETTEAMMSGQRSRQVRFGYLDGTWRAKPGQEGSPSRVISKATLLDYLDPIPNRPSIDRDDPEASRKPRARRVADRPEYAPLFPSMDGSREDG